MLNLDPEKRAQEYARQHGLQLTAFLGDGTDGNVWKTDRNTAVKAFQYDKNYHMELACYQRLSKNDVTEIMNLAVPRLMGYEPSLWVIEMGFVSPPCILDFGKAYLDGEPDHSAETWREHDEAQREIWEDRYSEVQSILWKLRQLGIFYRDASPRNIQFGPQSG